MCRNEVGYICDQQEGQPSCAKPFPALWAPLLFRRPLQGSPRVTLWLCPLALAPHQAWLSPAEYPIPNIFFFFLSTQLNIHLFCVGSAQPEVKEKRVLGENQRTSVKCVNDFKEELGRLRNDLPSSWQTLG